MNGLIMNAMTGRTITEVQWSDTDNWVKLILDNGKIIEFSALTADDILLVSEVNADE
jgi:hypothetical protein